MSVLLRVEGLQMHLGGRLVLSVPELAVHEGEVFAVLGPNGAGKSTLLRVLAALQVPQQGRLVFRGQEVPWRRALAYRRRVAVVLQAPLLLGMSAYANVALGLWLRGRRGATARRQALKWLARFQVEHLAHRPAHTLSGGEAQRVALARAFALEPEALFLDEPFSGLDMPTRLSLLADLRQALQETGRTAFLVTHDRDEALALADRVAVMFEGRLAQVGLVDEVFLHPRDEQVAAFVGVENRIPAQVIEEGRGRVKVRFPWGDEITAQTGPLPVGERCLVCVRPEEVALAPAPACEQEGHLKGRVKRSVPLGLQIRVEVDVAGTTWRVLLPRSQWQRLGLQAGAPVCLRTWPDRVHLLPFADRGGGHFDP